MDKIIFALPSGALGVITPALAAIRSDESMGDFLARLSAKRVPAEAVGVEIVDETALPDRFFRNAWRLAGAVVVEDPDECRTLRAAQYAAAKLQTLRGLRDREDLGENVTAERAVVRAVDPAAEAAGKTPDQLRAHWPGAIERREGGR